jgi:hypothetical protein
MEGALTGNDVVAVVREALSDPAYDVGLRTLIDARYISSIEQGSEAVRSIAYGVSAPLDRHGARGLVVIVAGSDVVFGLGRMYELLRSDSPENVRVCRTLEEAAAAFGLDPAELE